MASLTDILASLQHGVVAVNNFNTQVKGSFTNISGQFSTVNNTLLALQDNLAFQNILINGGMEVSQENGVNAVNANGYIVDMFVIGTSGGASPFAGLTGQQISPPGAPAFGAAFPKCLQAKATAGAAVAAASFAVFQHNVEGYRWARLGFGGSNPQALTLGFWVYATISGTMSVSIRNGGANRSYIANVTINSANTWQWVTIIVPGDTAGTWPTDNTSGALLGFCFATGSTFQTTSGVWQAGNFLGTASTTNFFVSTNNVVALTGVVLLPGAHQLSQDQSPNLIRPFDVELGLCQRYYEKSYDYATLPGAITNNGLSYISFGGITNSANSINFPVKLVRKRTVPSMAAFSPVTGAPGKGRDFTNSADVSIAWSPVGETLASWAGTMSAATPSFNIGTHWVADARM